MATLPTTTDIQRELERTRSTVEQLNRQVSQLTNDMSDLRNDVKSILNHLQPLPVAERLCSISSPTGQWPNETYNNFQQQLHPQRSLADNCSVDGSTITKHPRGGVGSSKKAVNFLPKLYFRSGSADNQNTQVSRENVPFGTCQEGDEQDDEVTSYGDNSDNSVAPCCLLDSQVGFVAPSSEQSQNATTSDECPVLEQTNENSGPGSGNHGSNSDVSFFVGEKDFSPVQQRRQLSFLTTDL